MARTPGGSAYASVSVTRSGWCASVSVAYASVSVRERVFSRTPEEWEDSDPITGIGLGVMPVRPHTPRSRCIGKPWDGVSQGDQLVVAAFLCMTQPLL